ncbi:transcriptional regulator BetI [Methylopila sp. M107]|uniref:transcriptional regulator BetI n=1 Tax=Methylopila sp. M107 TaxID=1101190 RepID=UPI00036A1D50|nr:transcriptional regulator BetI [Methylopila sp. M107]
MPVTAAPQDPTDPMRAFEAERRRHLIEATIETISEVGFKAASLGEIARRAGVSQGLFAHYFGDKEGLLEATVRFMASRLASALAARLRDARTPLERVLAVPETALARQEFHRRTSAVWLAFWGQILHSTAIRRVQSIYQRRMRSNLRHGLRELIAPERLDHAVAFIAATIDGVWLQSHATPDVRGDGSEARAAVRELIRTLISRESELRRLAGAERGAPALRLRSWAPADDGATDAWRQIARDERAVILRRVADRLRDERRIVARLEARDTLRPISDIERHDLPLVIRLFERAAEAAAAPVMDRVGLGSGEFGFLSREPLNRVVVRARRTAPLLEAARTAAPALAAGATALLCSSARKARALQRLAETLREAGAPESALGVACGADAERMMLSAIGPDWSQDSAKSAVVVLYHDDIRTVASALLRGPRRWARARSLSETLIFAAEPIRHELVECLRSEAASLALGDPTESETEVGPMIDRPHLERTLDLLQQATREGAKLRIGGRALETEGRSRSVFLRPTVLANCNENMDLARASTHAPIVMVCGYEDEAELVCRLGRLGRDLSLGVYGRDADHAGRLAREARVGFARINDGDSRFSAPREDWSEPSADQFETVRRLIVCGAPGA